MNDRGRVTAQRVHHADGAAGISEAAKGHRSGFDIGLAQHSNQGSIAPGKPSPQTVAPRVKQTFEAEQHANLRDEVQ